MLAPHCVQDRAPEEGSAPAYALYSITWVIIASFVLMNIFLGILLHRFYEENAKEDGSIFLSPSQIQYLNSMRIFAARDAQKRPTPVKGSGETRRQAFELVTSNEFGWAVAVAIGVNTLVLCTARYDQPAYATVLHAVASRLFTALFCAEAALKVYGLGWSQYIVNRWNLLNNQK